MVDALKHQVSIGVIGYEHLRHLARNTHKTSNKYCFTEKSLCLLLDFSNVCPRCFCYFRSKAA